MRLTQDQRATLPSRQSELPLQRSLLDVLAADESSAQPERVPAGRPDSPLHASLGSAIPWAAKFPQLRILATWLQVTL
ncbi:hypothetical protein PC116_g16658 [Phytophthora cactorum]|uniref:Uncharacterized protein n=1 Tax=Phytophthora cactorum TaxID=29920 RepID=A0A8T1KIK6_9STRA|nr:hypothetical protein Pcac1_g4185 [Phytophthora cactorum]KAG2888973.1 hypothetical protein PC114_g18163 [Phytophthora cactorum]KAG2931271.1 hypothetical protein PC117_g13509 [Phytophthora cactorum]KAG2997496.1 hypothetical protein PC119_g17658 [Phytophthora cactorum]KAG3006293.1 hypothetical protein PC120_g17451 [Phytophthora cactorum]